MITLANNGAFDFAADSAMIQYMESIGLEMPEILSAKNAESICGTMGKPSKMPGTSYGIPAQNCHTGSKLAKIPGSVCHVCYALRGNYVFPSVMQAQQKRLASLSDHRWIQAMVSLLVRKHHFGAKKAPKKYLPRFHRWHDSGDLQSRDHLAKICAVARLTPWLEHWIPTKEGKLVSDYKRDGGIIPSNLIIRLSGSMIDGQAPKALPHTSTVESAETGIGHHCPARFQDNKCGPCRACWNPEIPNIVYHKHT